MSQIAPGKFPLMTMFMFGPEIAVLSWLLTPRPNKPDPVPPFNQALRGTPMPITFGCNRVNAQITWTYGFNAQPAGGGKFGGSAGMGAAKGGGGGMGGYNYFWDLIYNFGMADQPSAITRGWIGADRIHSDKVVAWNQNVNPLLIQELLVLTGSEYTGVDTPWAQMNYIDGYAGNAFPTGDVRLEPWAYFQSKNGNQPFGFPSTMYVGFEQLGLGQTTNIPQLSVEMAPISNVERAFSNFANPTIMELGNGSISHAYAGTDGVADWVNRRFFAPTGSHNGLFMASLDTGTEAVFTSTGVGASAGCVDVNGFLYWMDQGAGNAVVLNKYNPTTLAVVGSFGVDGAGGDPTIDWPVQIGGNNISAVVGDADYIVGTSSNTVSVINADSMTFAGFSSAVLSQNRGRSCPCPSGAMILDFNNTAGFASTKLYFLQITTGAASYNIGSWPTPNPFITCTLRGTLLASAVDATWTDFSSIVGPFYDSTDGNVVLFAHTADAVVNQHYAVKINSATGALIWSVPVSGFGAAVNNANVRIDAGTMLYFTGAHVDYINTLTGQVIETVAISGVDSGCLCTDDGSGDVMAFGNYVAGVVTPAPGTPTSYTNLWGKMNGSQGGSGNILDVTPPYIIKQILTNTTYGFGSSNYGLIPITIDASSYALAVAQCQAQGIFVSVTYTSQDDLLNAVNDLLALYNGTLTEHNGVIYFNIINASDTSFRVLDNDHLLIEKAGTPPVQVTQGAAQDGYNSITYNFIDRSNEYKKNVVYVEDPVDIDFNGMRNVNYDSKYVMSGSLAQQCAERALWTNIYGRKQLDFMLGWKDADLRPGVQVTIVDSFHPALQLGVKAIITEWAEKSFGKFSVKASQIFDSYLTAGHGYINNSSAGGGGGGLVSQIMPLFEFRAYELPEALQPSPFVFFGYNQASYIKGAQLFISNDANGNYVLTQDTQPFEISGTIGAALPSRPNGYIETAFPLWLFPGSLFNTSSPTFVQTFALGDASQAARAADLMTMIVGSEAIALENLTLVGQNHYTARKLYRGWGGTPITSHNSGAYFNQHGPGTFALPITNGQVGTTLYYKIAGYDFAGNVYDISSITARSYQIKGMYWRPRVAADVNIFVSSAVSWPSSTPFRGQYLSLNSGGCDIALEWPPSANMEGFGAGGFGTSGFGHWAQDTVPAYRVNVSSSNGVAVSCYATTSGHFGYTVAQNSADFNGFAKKPIFQITPYTVKGDGPTSAVCSPVFTW